MSAWKRLLIVFGVIGFGFICLAAFESTVGVDEPASQGYTLGAGGLEELAVASIRVAVAESALNGEATVAPSDCGITRSIVESYDSDATWFSSCSAIVSGGAPDTSINSVLELSDGDYCATLTFDEDITVLTNYSFDDGSCGDSRLYVP